MMNKVRWFINDYFSRHVNVVNKILHIIGIPQVLFGIFQLFTGQWKWGLANFFLGYLWQWIGHTYFDKNEVGEVILVKKIIKEIFPLILAAIFLSTGGDAMALLIKSAAFDDGDMIPDKYTCKGEDISPPLFWENIPDGTKSFAIICEDPDAPGGMWSHWVIYNILKGITELPEGMPPYDLLDNGAKQGINDFGKTGYGGPAAPPGSTHRYFFHLYALDNIPELASGMTREQLLKAIKTHIIEEAAIMGRFKR